MTTLYEHVPHLHLEERRKRGPVTVDSQRKRHSPIARFNTRIGLIITIAVGSMWCAYLFTLLALISLPSAWSTGDKIIIVAWIAQTFLQLVLLPIIIVGQNVQAAAADGRSQQTYKDAEAILHECLELQAHLTAQDRVLVAALQQLAAVTGKPVDLDALKATPGDAPAPAAG